MDEMINKTNELLKNASMENKSYAMHYLWGCIKANIDGGRKTITQKELIELIQISINDTK